jgi:hypothetical protein
VPPIPIHHAANIKLVVLEVGCLDAVAEEEHVDGATRFECGVRKSERVPDPLRVRGPNDHSQIYVTSIHSDG